MPGWPLHLVQMLLAGLVIVGPAPLAVAVVADHVARESGVSRLEGGHDLCGRRRGDLLGVPEAGEEPPQMSSEVHACHRPSP